MKKKLKSLTASLLVIVLLFTFSPQVIATGEVNIKDIETRVQALLVANPETGEIYYSKFPTKILGIASMTKMLTYLVIKDEIAQGLYKLTDTVKITEEAAKYAAPGNSKMDLIVGEVITIEDLLKGLMIVSGNDAATALALKSSKTIKDFVVKMNAKAKEIGLTDYHFINPTGLSEYKKVGNKKVADYNKLPAVGLLKLAAHIVSKYPEVEEYGKLPNLSMPERNFVGEHTTSLFKSLPGLRGLKTGFTDEAKWNFTGYVDLDEFHPGQKFKLVTVVTGAETPKVRDEATRALVQYVDNNYQYKDILGYDKQYPVVDFEARDTIDGTFPLYLDRPIEGIFAKRVNPEISYTLFEDKKAPFEDGEILGEVIIKYEGKELDKVNLINKGYKPKLNAINRTIEFLKDIIRKLMLVF